MVEVSEVPKIIKPKVAKMIKFHVNKEKIVYIVNESENDIEYIIKSILRDSQVYSVTYDKLDKTWTCNCPAFKFRRRLNSTVCKHIEFIQTLLEEGIKIDSL